MMKLMNLSKYELAGLCSSARKESCKALIKGVLLDSLKTSMYGYVPCSVRVKFNPFVTNMATTCSHGCNSVKLIVFVGDKFMSLSNDTQKFIINDLLIDNNVNECLYGIQSELDCLKEYRRALTWRDFVKRKELTKRIKAIA